MKTTMIKYYNSSIVLGMLFFFHTSFTMEEKLSLKPAAEAWRDDAQFKESLKKSREYRTFQTEKNNLLKDALGYKAKKIRGNKKWLDLKPYEYCPQSYSLKMFRLFLKKKSKKALRTMLDVHPTLFFEDTSFQEKENTDDHLTRLVDDLVNKKFYGLLRLLLSLPVYPREAQEKWDRLREKGRSYQDEKVKEAFTGKPKRNDRDQEINEILAWRKEQYHIANSMQKSLGAKANEITGDEKWLKPIDGNRVGYQLDMFEIFLKHNDQSYVKNVLELNPTLFSHSAVDRLTDLIDDLVEQKSHDVLQKLLSLPLYPKEERERWNQLYQNGIRSTQDYQNEEAKEILTKAREKIIVGHDLPSLIW